MRKKQLPMMASKLLPLTIILVVFSLISTSTACHKKDKRTLLSIINSFPPNTIPPSSWNTSLDCCLWDLVQCDLTTGRVSFLHISNFDNLRGSIPPSVGDLPHLGVLTFSNLPGLTGRIPPQITKLKKLQTLVISNTNVGGPVPSFLSKLPALEFLDLGENKLSGPIPPSLGDLPNLYYLNLYQNRLTGTIPASLFSKPNPQPIDLTLSRNKLTGVIPESFGNVNFTNVDLSHNKLRGDASFLLRRSSPVNGVQLQHNKLAFDFTNVDSPETLQILDLSHNEVYGNVSEQIIDAPRLLSLDVSHNKLCGEIPTSTRINGFGPEAFEHNKCLCGAPLPPCQ